jgi:hypothetical protein
VTDPTILNSTRQEKPMVAGVTTFPKSIEQAVEDKLGADPGLKKQWEEVTTRFHLVYAQPEDAFKAIGVDAMLKGNGIAEKTFARIATQPESFGALRGRNGLLASRADKQDRAKAERNVGALAQSLNDYARLRAEAERKHKVKEQALRLKVAVDIPALSPNAKQVLERVRDAIDRNDLSAALEFALADKMVKAELDGVARTVSERFGERTFLSLAAKGTDGHVFQSVTADMTRQQKVEVQTAWNSMRTVQQLSVHERTAAALKQSETMRQTKNQGQTLK